MIFVRSYVAINGLIKEDETYPVDEQLESLSRDLVLPNGDHVRVGFVFDPALEPVEG